MRGEKRTGSAWSGGTGTRTKSRQDRLKAHRTGQPPGRPASLVVPCSGSRRRRAPQGSLVRLQTKQFCSWRNSRSFAKVRS
jgi:hypothetical protein